MHKDLNDSSAFKTHSSKYFSYLFQDFFLIYFTSLEVKKILRELNNV